MSCEISFTSLIVQFITMRILKCLLIFLSLGISYNVFAQSSGSGCYVASQNEIYTGIGVGGLYVLSSSRITACPAGSTSAMSIYSVTGPDYGPCRVALGPSGIVRDYTVITVTCPLDNYLPFLFLAAGGFGFFFLRKKGVKLG